MNFAEAIKNETKWTRTENGAIALNTTGTACLDLFGTIGALRKADEARITSLFEEAYKENPLLATKILFYARDIRGDKETTGLGERRVFRIILKYTALHHPECIRPNLDLIGVYGRYDDLYELIGTPLEDDMWSAMKKQFEEDKANLEKHVVSLSKTVKNLREKTGFDLGSVSAKVVAVLDYSFSMSGLYGSGAVQRTINKLVPLGLTFDDNGSIDVYLFQSDYRKMSDLNLENYESYIKNVVRKSRYSMGGTNYAPVLRAIITGDTKKRAGLFGFGGSVYNKPIVDNGDPTFVLFITDGENGDRRESDEIIRKSSEMNVFIQFIGIGSSSFKYLMELDDMPGRRRDNTGFSRMEDLDKASDDELYRNVLEQFSNWLKGLQ